MHDLVASGRVADIVLAVMALECVILAALFRANPTALFGLIGNLTGGAALVVALKLALTGGGWPWIVAALATSMAGHLVDLAVRLRRR